MLAPVLGEVSIENLRTLTGGASRTTWAFDAVGDGQPAGADPAHRPARRRARGHGTGGTRAAARGRRRSTRPPHPGRRQFPCRTGQSVPDLQRDRRRDDRPEDPSHPRRRRARAAAAAVRAGAGRHPPRRPGRDRPDTDRPAGRVARPARRDGRHHGDVRVGVSVAGRAPATADAAAAGARRLPDGQPDRRRVRPGRRAGLGTGPHRRGLRGPGLVLHPGLAVRCARGARRRRARQRRELPVRLRGGRGHDRRPRCVPVVADRGHAALGRHLPVPGRAPPVRADAVGRAGRDRPAGQRNRVGRAGSAGGRRARGELAVRAADRRRTRRRGRRLPRHRRARRPPTGRCHFHARVAANVLRTVERELLDETAGEVTDALAELGFADETQLAAAIRAGELDDRAGEVLPCLRTLVRHRLGGRPPGLRRAASEFVAFVAANRSRFAATNDTDGVRPAGPGPATRARRRGCRPAGRAPRRAPRRRRRDRWWCPAPPAPIRRRTPPG